MPAPHRRDLPLLAGAVCLSSLGDLLAIVALALHVHEITGSALAVSALFATTMLPAVALAPLAGRLADRVESVRLLALASALQAVVALALAFTTSLLPLLALALLLAAGATVSAPAEFALVPAIARKGRLVAANGTVEAARSAGMALGPVLAAIAVAAGGTGLALLVDAASFLAIVAAAALIRGRRPPVPRARSSASRRGGTQVLLADPVLRPVVLAAVGALLFVSAAMTIEVVFASEVLRVGDAGYAVLVAAWMAGMTIGSAGARRVAGPLAAAGAMIALAVQGSGFVLQAAWVVLPVALAGMVVGGIGHGVKNPPVRTLLHDRVPTDRHGRAFAAYNAARNSAELVALTTGALLVTVAGARPALVVAGLGPLVMGLGALAVLGRRRTGRMTGLAAPWTRRRVAALQSTGR
jgi:sugar phosphate permease